MISLSQLLSQPDEEEKGTHTETHDHEVNQELEPPILLQNEDPNTAIEPQRKSNLSA